VTPRPRIAIVATVPVAIKWFMRAHVLRLRETFDITLLANGSGEEVADLLGEHVRFVRIPIERKISLRRDVVGLWHLWRLFRRERFDVVHSLMPKAGLLTMTAGRLAGIRRRFHTFTGQVWAARTGFSYVLLKSLDRILVWNSTFILADSPSQVQFLITERVVPADKIEVLAEGSIIGVDLERFRFDPAARLEIRARHGIPDAAIVFLFLGRLTYDKGLNDLVAAFRLAAPRDPQLQLMVVGPDEEGFEGKFAALASEFPGRVHREGFVHHPQQFMAASDVFVLPSYREGFGSVIIEAAAVGRPAIASRIYGLTDAVEEEVTGLLYPVTDAVALADTMVRIAADAPLRARLGSAAEQRARSRFSEQTVTEAMVDFYRRRLAPGPRHARPRGDA